MTQRGNSNGGWNTTSISASMAAFDRCPPRLRDAMRSAVGRYSGEQMAQLLARGIPVDQIISQITHEDRRKTCRDYGPNHPEASA